MPALQRKKTGASISQPTAAPKRRSTTPWTSRIETSPSTSPTAANEAIIAASYQTGTPLTRPTWTKSVMMYGAFGRNRSHTAADGAEEGQPAAAAGAVVEDNGEHERDPGEEEVPGEELEVPSVRVTGAHREQRDAQTRGEHEREECRDPPIGELLHAAIGSCPIAASRPSPNPLLTWASRRLDVRAGRWLTCNREVDMGFDQYHEPPEELSAETRTFARMVASLTEEAEAIGWYEQRIAVEQDAQAKAIMENAQERGVQALRHGPRVSPPSHAQVAGGAAGDPFFRGRHRPGGRARRACRGRRRAKLALLNAAALEPAVGAAIEDQLCPVGEPAGSDRPAGVSKSGTYGLRSSTGVPSSRSSPSTDETVRLDRDERAERERDRVRPVR